MQQLLRQSKFDQCTEKTIDNRTLTKRKQLTNEVSAKLVRYTILTVIRFRLLPGEL